MSARAALTAAVFAAGRYPYKPDQIRAPDGITIKVDIWGTEQEFEEGKMRDCEDYAQWAIARAHRQAPSDGYYMVVGVVRVLNPETQEYEWGGHAWVELHEDGTTLWADPCWGKVPQLPAGLGWSADPERVTRKPMLRWCYMGNGLFDHQEQVSV